MRISDWSSDVCSSDLLLQVGLAEHRAHEIALLDADAMLAGQHAADLDAELQDVGAEVLRLLQLARLVGVVEDERMQVAVAGVKDVGDAQAVERAELARPDARRVVQECVSRCRSLCCPYPS